MSQSSDEQTMTPAERLNDALVTFTGCVGSAVDDICSYGLTIGETYVPFNPDPEDECDEDATACSQVWVRVTGTTVAYVADSFDSAECGGVFRLGLEVGVIRCFESPEKGEAPTASEVLEAAAQAMDDMNAIYCAAMGCEVWYSINSGAWSPMGPLGGQYGGMWTFDVEI